ncbi:MAG TPA: DUF3105 domain-containing protein [Mycobacteriales bacterium]|nr:DUF3105 domain-containing protein [Mycobacteriales bacterium]
MANKSKRPSAAQQVADRRQRVAEMRAQEKARDRRRKVFYGGGGGVIAAALVVVLILVATHKSTPAAQRLGKPSDEKLPAAITTGSTTTEPPAKVVTPTDPSIGITGVTEYVTTGWPTSSNNGAKADALGHNHVDGPIDYSVTPPVGGDHNAQWMNCGIYAAPVPSERAVHNLEHGAVWITYKPSLPQADVDALRAFVMKQTSVKIEGTDTGERYMDLSPWKDDSLPANIVMSSWGFQLKLDSATDPRMQQFVDKFRGSPTYAPEPTSPCNETDPSIGGKPFEGA